MMVKSSKITQKSMSQNIAKKLILNEIIKDNYKYFNEFLSELELSRLRKY